MENAFLLISTPKVFVFGKIFLIASKLQPTFAPSSNASLIRTLLFSKCLPIVTTRFDDFKFLTV